MRQGLQKSGRAGRPLSQFLLRESAWNRKQKPASVFIKSQGMYLTFYTRAEKSFALRNFSQPGFVRATRGEALSIESIAFNRRKAVGFTSLLF